MSGIEVRVRAVVFDLWLTLIPFPSEVRSDTFRRMSEVLGLEPSALQPHWRATRAERETMDLREHLHSLGRQLSVGWSEEIIEAAVTVRSQSHGACFSQPFRDGEDAIQALRNRGIAIGLISNCSSDVRDALVRYGMDTWFDQTVLSAEAGVMKPAPEIYAIAAGRLGAAKNECLYVGDGSDGELEGAAAVGMTPILYDRVAKSRGAAFTTVTSHMALLELINA